MGPIDFYIHNVGQDGMNGLAWAFGGNNPNGSGSIRFHVNN